MTQSMLPGISRDEEGPGGRTVVVGVKLDSHSRELLTWALVKVAQPGDLVIALHVLSSNEIVNPDGKSSLLSLVKAFDSILAVYEGFCNLKQVDLKLKICRGSSIRKILVREAKSYFATEIIVGAARTHHTIRSTVSIAKYCAKKLPKDCSVLAVDNGKIVFQRATSIISNGCGKGAEDHHRNRLLSAIQRSLSKNGNSKFVNGGNPNENPLGTSNMCEKLKLALIEPGNDFLGNTQQNHCSICSPNSVLPASCCSRSTDESIDDGNDDNSMALVPVQKQEAASSSVSLLIRALPEQRPGWPLLRRAVLCGGQASNKPLRAQMSVVQWAMQLPRRHYLLNVNPKQSEEQEIQSSQLDGEFGAIVPVDSEITFAPSSPISNSISLPKELEGFHEQYSATCRLFNYQELREATTNFISENLIGKGGSSLVYKGCLPDGKELAVKILKPDSENMLQEFMSEVETITALHHKNIISLFGFCFEDGNLLLVYDFLSKGSLEENLHGNKKDTRAFGWRERYRVAVGVAEALEYLHSSCDKPVIHRDVKSSNILLHDDFEPQLSDFGLAKWASTSSSQLTCTDVAGTFGYLAPEYFMYGKVTDKIDVYAFGVVILELLSGRKPISNDHPKGQESLVMWAKPILNSEKVAHLLDPCFENNYDHDQMERMVLAATLCIRRAPRARPQMSTVSKLLQGDAEVTKWAKLQVNASEGRDILEDEAFQRSNFRSHLNLALLDTEDDSLSMSSIEQNVSLEDYLQGRWSRSSSLD